MNRYGMFVQFTYVRRPHGTSTLNYCARYCKYATRIPTFVTNTAIRLDFPQPTIVQLVKNSTFFLLNDQTNWSNFLKSSLISPFELRFPDHFSILWKQCDRLNHLTTLFELIPIEVAVTAACAGPFWNSIPRGLCKFDWRS